ncbi:MAG: hypothetical protein Q4C86_02890 [bacterium]|nr:hypothetical protein [bacterium]
MTFQDIFLMALTAFTAAGSFIFAVVMVARDIWLEGRGGEACEERGRKPLSAV